MRILTRAQDLLMKKDWHGAWAVLMGLAFAILSAVKMRGGYAGTETFFSIPRHLEARPWYWHAFSPGIFEDNVSRGRSLSAWLDHVDAHFIALCTRLGFPHFLSGLHYLFLGLIGCLGWRFMRQDLRLSGRVSTLLLGCLLFASAPFVSVTYFRTAKIGAALMVFSLACVAYRWIVGAAAGKVPRLSRTGAAGVFALAFLGAPMDEIAGFFAGFFAALLGLAAYSLRSRELARRSGLVGGAFILSLVVKQWVYPRIVTAVQGYPPENWDHFAWRDELPNLPTFVFDVFGLLSDQLGFVFGNLPLAISGCLGILLLVYLADELNARGARARKPGLGVVLMGAGFAMVCVCLFVMKIKHSSITAHDLRRMYYFLPFQTLAWWVGTLGIAYLIQRKPARERVIVPILGVLLLSNLFSLSEHVRAVRRGHMALRVDESPAILAALRRLPEGTAQDVAPIVWENPVYQALRTDFFRRKGISQ